MRGLIVTFAVASLMCVALSVAAQVDIVINAGNLGSDADHSITTEDGIAASTSDGTIVISRTSGGVQKAAVFEDSVATEADSVLTDNTWVFTVTFAETLDMTNGDSFGVFENFQLDMHGPPDIFTWIGLYGGSTAMDPDDVIKAHHGAPVVAPPEDAGIINGTVTPLPGGLDALQLERTETELVMRYGVGGSFTEFGTIAFEDILPSSDVAYVGFVFGGPEGEQVEISEFSLEFPGVAPEVDVSISGPHILDVGDPLVLEATADGFDAEPTYQWSKDGEDLVGEIGDTLTISPAAEGDSGTYGVTATGEVDGAAAEAAATFLVMVGFATPLAGGLGLGVMAGACALAGVAAIRHRTSM